MLIGASWRLSSFAGRHPVGVAPLRSPGPTSTAAVFGGISQVNANGSVFSAVNPPGEATWYL